MHAYSCNSCTPLNMARLSSPLCSYCRHLCIELLLLPHLLKCMLVLSTKIFHTRFVKPVFHCLALCVACLSPLLRLASCCNILAVNQFQLLHLQSHASNDERGSRVKIKAFQCRCTRQKACLFFKASHILFTFGWPHPKNLGSNLWEKKVQLLLGNIW